MQILQKKTGITQLTEDSKSESTIEIKRGFS